jgi:carbonic anhydrase/acetyltransferase-like protein (isoleucine patch superfamily)
MRQKLFPYAVLGYTIVIYGAPAVVVAALYGASSQTWWRLVVSACAPVVYAAVLTTVAGVCSLPHQKFIVAGTFPRDLNDPVYFNRRLYGLCWTCLYYFKVAYYICLTVPTLKALTFRLFGYRGSLDFTIYPDTWVRDLPLHKFGDGAYLANRATLGSNIVMTNGKIRVGGISIGRNACVGHLALVGTGVCIGSDVEIMQEAALGINVVIGNKARIGPRSAIMHGAMIGEECSLGELGYVGACSMASPGIRLGAKSVVSARKRVCNQTGADAARCVTK